MITKKEFIIIKILITIIFILGIIFICNNVYADQNPCPNGNCTSANISNQIGVEHSQFLYYNNRSASYPIPHSPHRVMLPSYFVNAPNGVKYIPMLNMVQFHMVFEKGQLKKMVRGENWIFDADVEIDVVPLYDKVNESDRSYTITILFPVKGLKLPKANLLAQISARADDPDDATSTQVLAAICLKAMEYGANAIYVTGEGTERILTAFGWGIGASNTYASANGSGNATTMAGGSGYSNGSTKYLDQPFIQVSALKVDTYLMFKRINIIKKIWNKTANFELKVIKEELSEADINPKRNSVLKKNTTRR